MIGIIITAVIIGAVAAMLIKKKRPIEKAEPIRKIDWSKETELGNFKANGTSDKFVVSKDDRFEFIVENGVIIAFRDKMNSDKFVEYRGDDSVR